MMLKLRLNDMSPFLPFCYLSSHADREARFLRYFLQRDLFDPTMKS